MLDAYSPVRELSKAVSDPNKSKIISLAFRKSKQAKVPTKTWNDPKFRKLSAPNPNAQTLWLRLSVAPESERIPGLISITIEQLAHSLRWSAEDTRKCWKEIEDIGWGFADWEAGLVYLPNLIFQNSPCNPNMIKGWWRQFDDLPKCGLLYRAWWKIGEILALRGGKWHAAFQEASDVIFEGSYSGDAFSDIHACFVDRVIDFSKFKDKTVQTTFEDCKNPCPPVGSEESPEPAHSPPEEDPGPYAAKNIELFSEADTPLATKEPAKNKQSKHHAKPVREDYEKVAKALNDADKIVWDGVDRRYVTRTKLGINQKKCVDKILREGYSIDDLVKAILRKGEDAYRRPTYTDRDGYECSNRALVTLEHLARPGKMDYYLRQDDLDEHKKPSKIFLRSENIGLDEYNEIMAASPRISSNLPQYTEDEAFELARSAMLGI